MKTTNYQYIEYEVDGEFYCFESSIVDANFLKKFQNSPNLQINYQILKDSFNEEFCQYFAIYTKEILSDKFLDDFIFGEQYVYNINSKSFFDPATLPLLSESIANEKSISTIQKALVAIHKKYGKIGLVHARKCYLSQALIDYNHIILIDNQKYIKLDNKEYNPIQRSLDMIGAYSHCTDENIISAIFSTPSLLYDEKGDFYGAENLHNLIKEVTKRLGKNINYKLNYQSYWNAINICNQIYLEKYNPKYLKKTP